MIGKGTCASWLSERQPQPEALPAPVKPQAEVQIYPQSALAFVPLVCQASASSPVTQSSATCHLLRQDFVSGCITCLPSAEATSVCLLVTASELSPSCASAVPLNIGWSSHHLKTSQEALAGGDFS